MNNKQDNKQKFQRDVLPEEFASLKEAGEFWDTHSTADYEDVFEPVEFEIDLPPRTVQQNNRTRMGTDSADKRR